MVSLPRLCWLIAVSKYADSLPLYRQEAIYARDQVDIDRALMARWMGRVGFQLEILAESILAQIKRPERIFADETTLPTLAPGSGSTKAAYLWAYARDDRHSVAAGHQWLPIASKTAVRAIALPVTSLVIAASCRPMAMAPIIALRGPTAALAAAPRLNELSAHFL